MYFQKKKKVKKKTHIIFFSSNFFIYKKHQKNTLPFCNIFKSSPNLQHLSRLSGPGSKHRRVLRPQIGQTSEWKEFVRQKLWIDWKIWRKECMLVLLSVCEERKKKTIVYIKTNKKLWKAQIVYMWKFTNLWNTDFCVKQFVSKFCKLYRGFCKVTVSTNFTKKNN